MDTKGQCFLCNGVFDKAGMTKHLKSCLAAEARKDAPAKSGSREKKYFLLAIEGRYLPEYWLHLEISQEAALRDLDQFLRDLWLECCGHLSAFTIDKIRYSVSPMTEYREKGMGAKLGAVLRPRMKFLHEYDFGTTTELTLKVISERVSQGRGKKLRLLSRNEPPELKCQSCDQPAVLVCSQCIWDSEGWLCEACAQGHECGEDMFLPVVNSPRVGMCGYFGNAS